MGALKKSLKEGLVGVDNVYTRHSPLLASTIDPSDAFDAARETEFELRRRGRTEVSRAELRRLAHTTLCDRFGARTGERYLCWRHYQEPERPVVILLGGTTGAGKTSVALEVALRLGISRVLSTDSIRQVMRTLIPRELVPALHVSSFDAHRELPASSDSESPAVDGFIAQASAMSLGSRERLGKTSFEREGRLSRGDNDFLYSLNVNVRSVFGVFELSYVDYIVVP